MKRHRHLLIAALLALGAPIPACAQTTAFTYQGRLVMNGVPLSGLHDFQFTVYDAATFGGEIAGPLTNSAVTVSNGLFTATIDFGPGVFNGIDLWLGVAVRPTGGGAFASLTPLQRITCTPYAVLAGGVSGPIAAEQLPPAVVTNGAGSLNLSGTFAGNGVGLTNINAGNITSGTLSASRLPAAVFLNNAPSGSFQSGNAAATGTRSVAMGNAARAMGDDSFAVGWYCEARTNGAVAIGYNSRAGGMSSVALGGGSFAGGVESTALAGAIATGGYSFGLGRWARAEDEYSFVWSDSQSTAFSSQSSNTFNIRARGGVWLDGTAANPTDLYFGSNTRQMLNLWGTTYAIGVQSGTTYFRSTSRFSWFTGGVHSDTQNNPGIGGTVLMTLTSGGLTVNGTFVSASDRNAKEDFRPVDTKAVLEKVAALPLSEWHYKSDEEHSRHLGPMAQDFKAAFHLGADERHIATVDADGVALAAIQGLNAKVEGSVRDTKWEIETLKSENAALREELNTIRALLEKLTKN